MGTDFNALKDLTPERRVKELQKLIDSLRKGIKENENDIKDAEHLLAIAGDEAQVIEQVSVPETPESNIEEIAEESGRLALGEQRELEELLATAPPREEETLHQVAHRPISELYGELKNIYQRQQDTGLESQQDRDMIYAIRKGFEIKRQDGYNPATKDENLMTAAEQMADSMYASATGGYKRNPA